MGFSIHGLPRRLRVNLQFIREAGRLPGIEQEARRAVSAALRGEGVRGRRRICVVWTSRERLRRLNRCFRGANRFTDVIAFRYGPENKTGGKSSFHLPASPLSSQIFGDLYIAVPQARLNARRFDVPLEEELVRLVVHGTLHLLGYTDYVPRKRREMWEVQERILREAIGTARKFSSRRGKDGFSSRPPVSRQRPPVRRS